MLPAAPARSPAAAPATPAVPAADPPPASRPAPAASVREEPSVIVLVTIDTLREDHVGYRHPGVVTTPFIDALAGRGVYFTGCRAPSCWTPPSMASLFTGLYPLSHGVVNGVVREGGVEGQTKLSDELTTLAEMLRARGYRTVGVPSNLHLAPRMGFAQGFDVYWPEATFEKAGRVNDLVLDQLRKAYGPGFRKTWKERRTFLWVHYFDPHDPYFAKEPYLGRVAPGRSLDPAHDLSGMTVPQIKKRFTEIDAEVASYLRPFYASEVAYVDDQLRRLSELLELDDPRVLLVVTSDHGEELGDHGDVGHARTLYEEVLRIPMMWHWPGKIPSGAVFDETVSLVDVLPTMAEIVGAPAPRGLQGHSLLPTLRDGALPPPADPYASLHAPRPELLSLVENRWKVIHDVDKGTTRLFDLVADPRETNDRAPVEAARAARMRERVLAWCSSLPAAPRTELVPIDSSVRDQMESLGYLGGGH